MVWPPVARARYPHQRRPRQTVLSADSAGAALSTSRLAWSDGSMGTIVRHCRRSADDYRSFHNSSTGWPPVSHLLPTTPEPLIERRRRPNTSTFSVNWPPVRNLRNTDTPMLTTQASREGSTLPWPARPPPTISSPEDSSCIPHGLAYRWIWTIGTAPPHALALRKYMALGNRRDGVLQCPRL